jgi:hypothetical protein
MFRADNSAYSGVLETLKGTNAHGRGRPTAPSVDRNTTMHEKGKVVFRGSQLLKPSFQVIDFKEGFGRGEWIRTTDLLVPNQGISTTYEHRSLKTQGLHAFCLDPTWTLKAKLWANWVTVGPCLDPDSLTAAVRDLAAYAFRILEDLGSARRNRVFPTSAFASANCHAVRCLEIDGEPHLRSATELLPANILRHAHNQGSWLFTSAWREITRLVKRPFKGIAQPLS